MKLKTIAILVAVGTLGVPLTAHANVGTPLIWATLGHLVLGNAVIGAMEALLLIRVYRVRADLAVVLMILANYVSTWVGLNALADFSRRQNDIDLYNVNRFIWCMFAAAYVSTLLLEWPFVWICLWRTKNWLRRSITASLLVQSVSYMLLVIWYWTVSVNSLLTHATIIPPGQIELPADICVYYIADSDGDVYAKRRGQERDEKMFDLNAIDPSACLSFENADSKPGFQELVAYCGGNSSNDFEVVRLGLLFANENCPIDDSQRPMHQFPYLRPGMTKAPTLVSQGESLWSFETGYWAVSGIRAENEKSGTNFRLALEMPFVQWPVCRAIGLPHHLVLFQLGNWQQCILDPKTKTLAILCYGRGGVAVLRHFDL